MKFWKKWNYLILMAAVGLFYLCFVDHWQIYAQTLEQTREFCRVFFDGESGDVPPGMSEESREKDPEQGDGGAAEEAPSESPSGREDIRPEPDGGEPSEALEPSESDSVEGAGSEETQPEEEAVRIPEFVTVEDDYFADAVFIGDSRTVGMYEYGGLEEISTFYASTGLTVYKLFDSAIVKIPGQRQKITVEEALQNNSFAKIYLMIGINEMGTGTVETFIKKYGEVVAHLQELQPDAVIYIQGIIKVTAERSNQGDYINNEGIEARNLELEKLADNEKIFYLDVNPLICDETGGIVDSYTFDGVHLKARYIEIWKDYLKEHAVSFTVK
ncbi:MAG: GDSL-type esterase/lipase family protein [bacterium]|nr:GDSL-type esterase/lipase family protein [bacterium]